VQAELENLASWLGLADVGSAKHASG
jgi:hypothetical protein